MNNTLRIVLIICSLLTLAIVVINTRKNNMFNKYSVFWIIVSLLVVVLAVFPDIIFYLSNLLGFEKPVNAVFLIALFIIFFLVFYLFIKISDINRDITDLNYHISLLKKKLDEKEKNHQ